MAGEPVRAGGAAGVLLPTAERVSFQVHRVNAKLAQVANPIFRTHAVDLISSRLLVLLLEKGETRVGELVEAMVLPQSTISHQLQRLEKRGLIRRKRVEADNRAVAVALSVTGREVAAECNRLSLDIYSHLTQGLAESEIADLRRLLTRMFTTLESYTPPAG